MNVNTRQVLREATEEVRFEAPEGVEDWPIMRRPRTMVEPPVPTQLTIDAAARMAFCQGISIFEHFRTYHFTSYGDRYLNH